MPIQAGANVFAELVQSDTPEGFEAFYSLVQDQIMPDMAREWVASIYAARAAGRPSIIESFRGSTKTTTLTQLFTAYRTGLAPGGTALMIQASDDAAVDNSARVADVIQNTPGWQVCFPYVQPDTRKGWGAGGYEVVDTRLDYGEFRRRRTKDPSFIGLGYKSKEVVGKHPSNILMIDDIITEESASSDLELARVVKTYSGTILPTRRPGNPWLLLVGTPWNLADVLSKAKESGEYTLCRTPVYRELGHHEPGAVWYQRINQWVRLAWPEQFSIEQIETERRLDLTGGAEFDRMYRLDLTGHRRRALSYMLYPSDHIDWNWPIGGGCDPAGVADAGSRTDGQHSHFAHAHLAKMPAGGAIILGGTLEQCDLAEGLEYLQQAQDLYSSWLTTVVEGDGIGEAFVQMIRLKPRLRLQMLKTGLRSKPDRIVNSVGPWTRIGRVKVSDADSPFLNALRLFANQYPNVSAHDPGWDAWDAVYWALRGMPDVLQMPEATDALQVAPAHRLAVSNPWGSFGRKL